MVSTLPRKAMEKRKLSVPFSSNCGEHESASSKLSSQHHSRLSPGAAITRVNRWCKWLLLLVSVMMFASSVAALTDPVDTAALVEFKNRVKDSNSNLKNWKGDDPCGSPWKGIECNYRDQSTNVSYVTAIHVLNFNLGGTLAPELGNLSYLRNLDVMWNQFTGSIPPTIGNLKNLIMLLLNGNQLSGGIPPELGKLTNLNRFQIDKNQLSGPIPPTLGNMTLVRHLHMNNNSLRGSLPKELGQLRHLNHILLDNNEVTGPLPAELSQIPTLTIIQMDNNPIADIIPPEWAQSPSLIKLSLRNCTLSGSIPDLSAMTNFTYLDLSYNDLVGLLPSNLPSNLSTINLSYNRVNGTIPESFGTLQNLQALQLANNMLTGSIPQNLGSGQSFSNSSEKLLVDLRNNLLFKANAQIEQLAQSGHVSVWLSGNQELCDQLNTSEAWQLCTSALEYDHLLLEDSQKTTTENGTSCSCTSPSMSVAQGANGGCRCAQPVTVDIRLKSPSFTFFDRFKAEFLGLLTGVLNLTDSQVRIQSSDWEPGPRLHMTLLLFPLNSTFDPTEYQRLFDSFANWDVSAGTTWALSVIGPYELLSFYYGGRSSKGLSTKDIVGIALGCVAFAAVIVALATYLVLRRPWKSPQKWGPIPERSFSKRSISLIPPGIKLAGVKAFTYEELMKATDNFSSAKEIGYGGYGKVYKGILEDDMAVAIKRARQGSMQGAREFYTEIELLSRVHHRNLVALVGFCNDQGEQMLVYEFMAGGTLRDHLIPTELLDFQTRLRIALGTARGLLYLHTEADPPIYHRDIKANNILLDEKYNAKVADFGLSRLAPTPELSGSTPDGVSTVVKGTPGYLDPEYFMTNKLTDKSDVYSLGVVLLELITGMKPISHGKSLVREANAAFEEGRVLSIVDPCMGSYPSEGIGPFVKLAISCCKSDQDERPNMVLLTRELEDIWRLTADSRSPSFSIPVNKESGSFSTDMGLSWSKAHSTSMNKIGEDCQQDFSALSTESSRPAGLLGDPLVAPR